MTRLSRVAAFAGIIASALFAATPSYSAVTSRGFDGTAWPAGTYPGPDRTVTLSPNTESVSVDHGETVRFVAPSGGEVTWKFDGMANKVFVPDVRVPIYVNQNKSPMHGFSE